MTESVGLKNRKRRKGSGLDFAMGAALGALFFVLVFGVSTLDVTYDGWIYAGYMEQDILQSYAGWMYFREAPWAWPLTVAENISIPLGVSIAYTDSIPLVAVVLKVFSPLLPATFQYFGWYNLLNCMLQGGFAMLLLRRFDLGRVYSIIASLFFVGAPIFVERLFRHSALGSQWIVLAALLCYFTARHREKFPALGFWLLCTFAIGIHGYFVPMVYALLLAALLERVFKEKKILKPAIFMGLCFAGTLVVAYVFGLLTRGGVQYASHYGHYSMNLNALFNPASRNFYADDLTVHWSRILPVLPQNEGQYDGFNYLGFGVLLALSAMLAWGIVRAVLALARGNKTVFGRAWRFVKSHGWLIAILLCLGVFAVSTTAVFNETTLFSFALPEVITRFFASFRSSGRLFWPVAYLLTLTPLVFVGRVMRGRWKIVAVLVLTAVQLFDISGALVEKHQHFAQGPIEYEDEFSDEGWQFLMENYNTVLCLNNAFDYQIAANIIRYNPDVQTNILLANQGNFDEITLGYSEVVDELCRGGPLPDDTLYLTTDKATFEYILVWLHPGACGYEIGRVYVICNPVPDCPLPEYVL